MVWPSDNRNDCWSHQRLVLRRVTIRGRPLYGQANTSSYTQRDGTGKGSGTALRMKGKRGSGVANGHVSQTLYPTISALRNGLRKGDDHPAYTPLNRIRHHLPLPSHQWRV